MSIFSCASWSFVSSLEKCLFLSTAHFLFRVLAFFIYIVVFWILIPYQMYLLQIFFRSVGYLFVLLMISFTVKNLLSQIRLFTSKWFLRFAFFYLFSAITWQEKLKGKNRKNLNIRTGERPQVTNNCLYLWLSLHNTLKIAW